MASCLFNGTTTKDENTTATGFAPAGSTFTITCWALPTGQGEGNFGRIFQAPELDVAGTTHGYFLAHMNAANSLLFACAASPTQGSWVFPITDNAWNAVALSWVGTSITNKPTVRVNFTAVDPSQNVVGSGAPLFPSEGGYCIGNRTGADRTWAGRIAWQGYHNVALAAREMDQALRRPGSVRRGLVLLRPLRGAGDTADLSGGGRNGTQTAMATAAGPPAYPGWAPNSAWAPQRTVVTPPAAAAGWGKLLAQRRFRRVAS